MVSSWYNIASVRNHGSRVEVVLEDCEQQGKVGVVWYRTSIVHPIQHDTVRYNNAR
jgi:hypothetical protein